VRGPASGARADVALAVGKAIDRFCERRNAPRDVAFSLTSFYGAQKPFEQARVALTVNGDAVWR